MPTKALPSTLPGYDLAVKILSITGIDKAVLPWHAPSGTALYYHPSRLRAMPQAVPDAPLASCYTNTIVTKCSEVIADFSQLDSTTQSLGIEKARR